MTLDRNYTALVRETFRKRIILQIRYPLQTTMRFIVMYVFFVFLFFGGRAVGGANVGETLDALVVGFFLWSLTTTAYQSVANDVTRESQWGTLEQMVMAVQPFQAVMVVKVAVNVAVSFLYSSILLVVMMLTTGRWLSVDLVTVGTVAFFAILSAVGVGLALGGIALVHKQVSSVIGVLQFAFVALISAPEAGVDWIRVLPVSQGAAMLQSAMREGTPILAFDPLDLALLVGVGVGYFALGLGVLSVMLERGRTLGVIGDY